MKSFKAFILEQDSPFWWMRMAMGQGEYSAQPFRTLAPQGSYTYDGGVEVASSRPANVQPARVQPARTQLATHSPASTRVSSEINPSNLESSEGQTDKFKRTTAFETR